MKKVFAFLLLTIFGCSKNGEELDRPDQILLLPDREVVCNEQTVTFRLFSQKSKGEISLSDFVFDPIPNGAGSITSSGLLTLNSITSESEITISGIYRSSTKLSTKIRVKPLSVSSQPSLTVSDFSFYNQDQVRPFYIWPDGSIIMGTPRYLTESLKKFEAIKYSGKGNIEWKKELGPGEARFINILNDKIYLAGMLTESGGSVFFYVVVLDKEGNMIKELKIPATTQHRFEGFQVDLQENFYLSTFKTGENLEIRFQKLDSNGIKIWEIFPNEVIKEIFIFQDGNIATKKSTLSLAETINLSFLDRDGQLIKEGPSRYYPEEPIFLGPNGSFGLAFQEINQANSTSSKFIDLFNSQGTQIATKQLIGQPEPYTGTLDHPAQKKMATAGFIKAYTDSSGQIHFLESAFWGDYVFLTMNSSSGEKWVWWKENKSRTAEGVLYPLQITEDENSLIFFGHSDGKLYHFRLGIGYSFDDCIREPYWNKLELF